MISRVLVTRPPGVFSRRITTSARRSVAIARASFKCLAVAGPIAPSISMVKASLALPLSSPATGEGAATKAATKATARRAARASFKLKAPYTRYGFTLTEIHVSNVRARTTTLAVTWCCGGPYCGIRVSRARQGGRPVSQRNHSGGLHRLPCVPTPDPGAYDALAAVSVLRRLPLYTRV